MYFKMAFNLNGSPIFCKEKYQNHLNGLYSNINLILNNILVRLLKLSIFKLQLKKVGKIFPTQIGKIDLNHMFKFPRFLS